MHEVKKRYLKHNCKVKKNISIKCIAEISTPNKQTSNVFINAPPNLPISNASPRKSCLRRFLADILMF